MKLVIASHNKGKIEELRALLRPYFAEVISMRDAGIATLPDETGETFFENAKLKAEYVAKATGFACIADDSGLCVNALGGAPGVYSARYAGKDGDDGANNEKLLGALAGVTDRTAYFSCAIVLIYPNKPLLYGKGETSGRILTEKQGESGFGYDPIFFSDELQKSFGIATAEEKNKISHRARAIADLMQKWKEWL